MFSDTPELEASGDYWIILFNICVRHNDTTTGKSYEIAEEATALRQIASYYAPLPLFSSSSEFLLKSIKFNVGKSITQA
jgi:hypothetical protein